PLHRLVHLQTLTYRVMSYATSAIPANSKAKGSVTRDGDPGGIRTRDLDLERVASWARLDDGVSERQYTRPRAALSDSGGEARSSRPSIAPPGDWPRRSPATRAPAARAPRRASRPR